MLHILLNKNFQNDVIVGANFVDNLVFIIKYDAHIITWVDHSIPLKDLHEFFCPIMLNDLNDQIY